MLDQVVKCKVQWGVVLEEKWKEEQEENFQTKTDVKRGKNLNTRELPFSREPFREYLCKVEMWTNCILLFPQKGP